MKQACPKDHPYPESRRPGRSDCAVCHRESQLRRYQADPEASKAAAGRWQRENRERRREYMRQYRDRRRDYFRTYFREYARAHRTPRAERYEWGYLLTDPCSYCGGPAGEVDHIQPRSRGGSEGWDNLTAACRACNARKHAMPLLAFLLKAA